jgi:hypothetical protein
LTTFRQYIYSYVSLGGVAQWTSHLLQKQKTRVRIPPGFLGKHSNAVVYYWINLQCLCVKNDK